MRHPAHALACALVAGTLSLSSTAARSGTAWLCNLSDDLVQLICIADTDPLDEPDPVLQPVSTLNSSVRGIRFPLDTALVWTVDLWSPPTELDQLELLARSTICYRSPGCTVTMAPQPWTAALSRRALPARTLARR